MSAAAAAEDSPEELEPRKKMKELAEGLRARRDTVAGIIRQSTNSAAALFTSYIIPFLGIALSAPLGFVRDPAVLFQGHFCLWVGTDSETDAEVPDERARLGVVGAKYSWPRFLEILSILSNAPSMEEAEVLALSLLEDPDLHYFANALPRPPGDYEDSMGTHYQEMTQDEMQDGVRSFLSMAFEFGVKAQASEAGRPGIVFGASRVLSTLRVIAERCAQQSSGATGYWLDIAFLSRGELHMRPEAVLGSDLCLVQFVAGDDPDPLTTLVFASGPHFGALGSGAGTVLKYLQSGMWRSAIHSLLEVEAPIIRVVLPSHYKSAKWGDGVVGRVLADWEAQSRPGDYQAPEALMHVAGRAAIAARGIGVSMGAATNAPAQARQRMTRFNGTQTHCPSCGSIFPYADMGVSKQCLGTRVKKCRMNAQKADFNPRNSVCGKGVTTSGRGSHNTSAAHGGVHALASWEGSAEAQSMKRLMAKVGDVRPLPSDGCQKLALCVSEWVNAELAIISKLSGREPLSDEEMVVYYQLCERLKCAFALFDALAEQSLLPSEPISVQACTNKTLRMVVGNDAVTQGVLHSDLGVLGTKNSFPIATEIYKCAFNGDPGSYLRNRSVTFSDVLSFKLKAPQPFDKRERAEADCGEFLTTVAKMAMDLQASCTCLPQPSPPPPPRAGYGCCYPSS